MKASGFLAKFRNIASNHYYIFCLRTFFSLYYTKLNFLSFAQRFESSAIDIAIMNKNIGAFILLDEAETFVRIKPFHSTGICFCHHN